jgi:hypothetical protein
VLLFAPKLASRSTRDRRLSANISLPMSPRDAAVQSRIVDLGYQAFPHEQQTPEALGALVESDAEKWWPLIKDFGIR